MASNILSRVLPPTTSPSIYETMKEYHDESDSDVEERGGLTSQRYRDNDLETALDDAIDGSEEFDGLQGYQRDHTAAPSREQKSSGHRKVQESLEPDEAEDDVPSELLVETDEVGNPIPSPELRARNQPSRSPKPIPSRGSTSGADRARWDATQRQQKLHQDPASRPNAAARPFGRGRMIADPKEKAMWRWINVQNLDVFLHDVYTYFCEKGIYSIILNRILNLLTFLFVVSFSFFLTSCIDYSTLRESNKLSDVYVKQCSKKLSAFSYLLIWICAFFWLSQLIRLIADIARLKNLHDLFHYLLDIPDIDIQTISWQDVVKRLMALRDLNPTTATKLSDAHRRFLSTQSKQRMDAHDIANRLMRKDNYLISLMNKDTLNLSLRFPFIGDRPILSRTLEWNLSLCILDYIFDERGQVKPIFIGSGHRKSLSLGLRSRFFVVGILNILVGPFLVIYVLLLYFFRNFSEYRKDPSLIGSRQYTPYAKWKFREFNELPHLFQQRMNMSYPFASRYIDQFPKEKIAQLARFVAFISGALAGVLGAVTLLDQDLGFEITKDRTAFFYLTLFSGIWAVARGQIPEETLVFDPEWTMRDVIHFTHYEPSTWQGKLHSDDVRKEFVSLYQMKLIIFLQEVLSMITTPYLLIFCLPQCSERIVDFVREFTVHVDGLGYVCSFAVFDFQTGQDKPKRSTGKQSGKQREDLREEYYSAKDNKMMASYFNFMDHYASNPQRPSGGITQTDRQFHPPPAFPGLMSSQLMRGSHSQGPGALQSRLLDETGPYQSRSRYQPRSAPNTQKAPRFSAQTNTIAQPSPLTTILLDPQNQPSPGFRGMHKSKHRNLVSSKRRDDLMEDVEEDEPSSTTSGHGELGESWMMKAKQEGELDDEDDDDSGEDVGGFGRTDKGQGTLGLVYQIVKEQTADRGTSIL